MRQGFTLLEIVMVLAIAAVLAGGAIGMMIYSSDERALRDVSGEVELLAKRARTIAILHQTPYALEFTPGKIRLLPLAEAGLDDKGILDDVGITTNDDVHAPGEPKRREPVRDTFTFPGNMAVSIRRWNTQQMILLERNAIIIWRFDPDGLCEPLSVRYALENNNWVEDTFHPLTASISDSQMEVR